MYIDHYQAANMAYRGYKPCPEAYLEPSRTSTIFNLTAKSSIVDVRLGSKLHL